MSTLVKTLCSFICFFILLDPPVVASIGCPALLFSVLAPILSFILGCSVCSGLSFCCCVVSVFCCLLVLPAAISSVRVCVRGGSGGGGGRLDVVCEVGIGDVGPASPGRSRCCLVGGPSCCGVRFCSFAVLVPASCVLVRDLSVLVSLVGRATLVAICAVGAVAKVLLLPCVLAAVLLHHHVVPCCTACSPRGWSNLSTENCGICWAVLSTRPRCTCAR